MYLVTIVIAASMLASSESFMFTPYILTSCYCLDGLFFLLELECSHNSVPHFSCCAFLRNIEHDTSTCMGATKSCSVISTT